MTKSIFCDYCGAFQPTSHFSNPDIPKCNDCRGANERGESPALREPREITHYEAIYQPNALITRAHRAIALAIKQGVMTRADTHKCTYCGGPAKDWHHYAGYEEENWLVVQAVCRSCHQYQ